MGEPLELYGKPRNKFVAGFIGSPAMNFIDATITEAGGALWVEAPGLRLKAPADRFPRLGAKKGQSVTLGIRPEDLRPANPSDGPEVTCDALVDVVEPLGADILLDLKVGSSNVVVRVDPSVRFKVHEKIRLAFFPQRLHFFDAKTEESLL